MHKFKENDTVTFLFKKNECHGTIQKIGKKNAEVLIDELYETKTIPLEKLTYVPPVILTNKQVRDLCRYAVRWSALKEGYPDYAPVLLEKTYTITFEDILDAVHNIIVSGDVGVSKPDPAIYGIACRRFGVAPGTVWYAGDNYTNDVVAAARAGLHTIWFNRKHFDLPENEIRPDCIVYSEEELCSLLLRETGI